ncbi:MAG: phosphatidylserine decarboxylase [Candidatus Scalindua sp.]|nr:phosphatidylserine decarboxylase [Candidatus Scalindua sp.]MBT5303505.1 phosphatidylserine decarboxylase [Candidatus Scalindua sp.]MBT6560999.1 phosphatidylserine decarboxylase [Candidatus Scalindua sp.]MBT7213126.1 phosphatidylserine decarboxylase [Candidatus Scalindua sp.]MBT7592821.1 phosphatidylserine decarboxylase [Candidatus Scalindua sp.]
MAKKVKKIKNEQTKNERQPELHQCHTPEEIVGALKHILRDHKGWEELLEKSLKDAHENAKKNLSKEYYKRFMFHPADTLDEYCRYLEWFVNWKPHEYNKGYDKKEESGEAFNKEVFFQLVKFYWLLDQPTGRELQNKEDLTRKGTGNDFTDWMVHFANDWGHFLNTPESIDDNTLQSFIDDPDFKMFQYLIPPEAYTPRDKHSKDKPNSPSGWQTFNQFFAREINPGLRPVAGMFDDNIIISPADSTFKAKFHIGSDSVVKIKHTHKYHVEKLLADSPHRGRFSNGLFYHAFLGPNDYHRFRAPVRGTVLESRAIQEKVFLNVVIKADGTFDAPDGAGDGYEFSQTRGLLMLDSPIGLVAVIPIGMAQVSSVNMTAVVGSYLNKGDEFGYFLFGGSDIIVLFEAESNVTINTAPGIHYNTGMCIGEVIW